MIFDLNKLIQAKLPPLINRISNMYVYSEIVDLFLISNSQVPIMGFLPIKSKFQKSGNWVFNPSIYVKVREKKMRTFTITISTETGDEFFLIQDDVVTYSQTFASDHSLLRPI